MSVYRDTNTNVVFEHPHPGPLTATVYREGTVTAILTQAGIVSVSGTFTLPLTYAHTASDGKLTVVWSDGAGFIRNQRVDVVTPLVSLTRLRTLFPDENKTDAELARLEATVRSIIEAYTKQKFGLFVGIKTFVGTGGNTILLEQRLNVLTAFSGGWPGVLKVINAGWGLAIIPESLIGINEAPPEEFLTYVTSGVIRIPEWYIKRFTQGSVYTVTGEWGYDAVPDEVQEAAMLLANDFACNESIYHDRYLESVKIQQDTIVYSPSAYLGTGNSRADMLLAKYVRPGVVIV